MCDVCGRSWDYLDWKLFGLTFATIFLAEIGDKTQLAVFTLVAQHQKIMPIFIGASLALTSVSLIGALCGSVVSKFMPTEYLQVVAGLLFVGMGIVILIKAFGNILA